MTLGDWAGIGTAVVIAILGGSIKGARSWAVGLGKRLDKLEECIEERIDGLADRVSTIEGQLRIRRRR